MTTKPKKERRLYEVNSYDDMLAHPTKSYREISTDLLENQPITSADLAEISGFSTSTVQYVIKYLRSHGLVYISGWRDLPPASKVSVFSVGGKPDVPKSPRKSGKPGTKKVVTPTKFSKRRLANMKELAAALVPQRNVLEQAEVNRLYVNWIGDGIYD